MGPYKGRVHTLAMTFLASMSLLVSGQGHVAEHLTARRLDVYIAGFFPYNRSVEHSATGRGVMPSVKLAIDHVNEHNEVLRNYRLHMWWNDTECNAAVGMKSFFDMMHSGPNKLMLFGAACTHVTDPIAKASKHWQLTQLSYADTHPMFTKEAFPNFFRIVPSENAFNAPRRALLKEFNWTRVGTVYQNEPRYSLAHNRLVADLDVHNLEVVETQSFASEVTDALSKLRSKDVRVILGNFNESWARRIFCEAYRLEMYGRAYQWLIMGTYSAEWWTTPDDINCTVDQLETALESTILTDLLPLSTSGDITISGITADEYRNEYDSRRGDEYSRFHGYTYDGIWAVAMAIQHVAHRVRTVADFRYRDPSWGKLFLDALNSTSFEGVTGPVRFYDNERRASILLKQFQNGVEVKVGEYSSDGHLDMSRGDPLRWVGRAPPKDRTLHLVEHSQVNITIYVVLASCAALGIVMASVFLAINIKYRNQRYIKMSSPHLNNLIIVGCMLTYLSVIFLGLDSGLSSVRAFPYICTARAWLLMAGFSLAFGAMFSKTWRVHSIFTDLKLNKKVIKDYQLFMVVGVLLAVDLAIMTTWQVADPFYRETKQLEPYPHPTSEDVLVVRENEYCQSERMTIFVGVIYAYKGLLMIFGAFLAWETRHVSIPALNDSKHVGLSVYNVVIMCIMGAAIALVLSDRKDAMFVLISVFIIFCTTATLCLVFVPKLVELRRNPGGSIDKRIRATLRPMSKTRRDSSACELEQRLKEVKTTNCRFRKALVEREAELQVLMRRLGPEARGLLEPDNKSIETGPPTENNRLSVPVLRRELPSGTETTELTSLCSLSSSQDGGYYVNLQHTPGQRKKRISNVSSSESPLKDHTVSTTETLKMPPTTLATAVTPSALNNAIIATDLSEQSPTKYNVTEPVAEVRPRLATPPPTNLEVVGDKTRCVSFSNHDNRLIGSNGTKGYGWTPQMLQDNTKTQTLHRHAPHGLRSILSSDPSLEHVEHSDRRRVSIPSTGGGRSSFVVSQSDLWDTATLAHGKACNRPATRACPMAGSPSQTNHRRRPEASPSRSFADCEKHHASTAAPMQRSVSEKNRHHSHRHKTKTAEPVVAHNAEDDESAEPVATNTRCSGLARGGHVHHQSTPNVATARSSRRLTQCDGATKHVAPSGAMYGASSESELLDGAILPIFRKLLTERDPRRRVGVMGAAVGASCPNISIKCDIVEYL